MAITRSDRPSLSALVTQLAQDGIAVARAEVDVVKARLGARVAAAKTGIVLIAVAAVIAFLAAIGLIVGIILALATLVGPGIAGLIVAVVGFAIAGLLGWIGSRRLSAPTTMQEASR